MKRLLYLSVFVLAMLSISQSAIAQKYGHINAGNLLVQMPATKAADSELEAYQKQLGAAFEKKVNNFRERAGKFLKDAQGGVLPQIEIQKKQAEFAKEEQVLAQEEQDILTKVQKKREELLKPILEKVNAAINKIGKEKGYSMIFDTSVMNTVLFAQDSDDVMALVKAELGL
ncbi:MAG: OmpH family outer membrane protein [Bacteroidota bacterium]